MNIDNSTLFGYIFKIIIFLFAGAVHEFSHAFSAYILGDNTAKFSRRLTLNPFSHIDIIGSVIFPFFSLLSGFFFIGWMKPVPINSNNFSNPDKGSAITSFAGPFSNLLQALLGLIVIKIIIITNAANIIPYDFLIKTIEVLHFYILINIILMIFNFLPFPPLDGGWILRYFLPSALKEKFDSYFRYGFLILAVIIFTDVLKYVFNPFYKFLGFVFKNIDTINILYFLLPFIAFIILILLFIKNNFSKTLAYKTAENLKNQPVINIEKNEDINKNVELTNTPGIKDILYKYENSTVLTSEEKKIFDELKSYSFDIIQICKEMDFYPYAQYCIDCNYYKNCISRKINNSQK